MGRVFASSDWHGVWAVAEKIFDYLKSDDTLYFLGDAGDRGKYGIKIIQTIMADPRIKMIKGNHDEFMSKAIKNINYEEDEIAGAPELAVKPPHFDMSFWISGNGGEPTYNAIWKLSKVERVKIAKFIDNLSNQIVYNSPNGHTVLMEHAGYSPFVPPHRYHDPLWDREHFFDGWNEGWGCEHCNPDNIYLVHGHTPVQYLKFYYGYKDAPCITKEERYAWECFKKDLPCEWNPTIIRYCDGHKFDIDMCTIDKGRVALLDLDTFEEIYFEGKDE